MKLFKRNINLQIKMESTGVIKDNFAYGMGPEVSKILDFRSTVMTIFASHGYDIKSYHPVHTKFIRDFRYIPGTFGEPVDKISNISIHNLVNYLSGRVVNPKYLRKSFEISMRHIVGPQWLSSISLEPQEITTSTTALLYSKREEIRRVLLEMLIEHVEIEELPPLPLEIEDESVLSASLNVYGIYPAALTEQEKQFAELLENNLSGVVSWWHYNAEPSPYALEMPLWDEGLPESFRPSFVVGIPNRTKNRSTTLIEVVSSVNANDELLIAKVQSANLLYGRVHTVYHDEVSGWRILDYNLEEHSVSADRVFDISKLVN